MEIWTRKPGSACHGDKDQKARACMSWRYGPESQGLHVMVIWTRKSGPASHGDKEQKPETVCHGDKNEKAKPASNGDRHKGMSCL